MRAQAPFVVIILFVAACSSTPSTDATGPATVDSNGHAVSGQVVSAPVATVTCDDVCANVTKCGVA